MPPLYLISILFVVTSPNLVTNSNVVQTLNGQIVPVPKMTNFFINCANCVEQYPTITTTNGKFQIELKAKDGDKIGQIGVNIMSCSKLGNQIRSNTWTIEEPNSGEFYKFFIGHFSPDPKSRLFLRVRFDGKLPELADPDAFYSVLLKKPNTEINQIDQKKIDQVNESDQSIFAQISVNGKDAAARDEWTGDKGLMLKLNEEGIKYLRENKMPAMELQLTEVGRDDDADSFQDNYRELRELERATLSEELTTNSGGLSPFIFVTRQNSKSLKSAEDTKFDFERLNAATKGNPPMDELSDQRTKSKLPFGSKWKSGAAGIGHPIAQHYHKRRSGSSAASDSDGTRLGNRRSINAEHLGGIAMETLGTNAQYNDFGNDTESRTPSCTKNIRANTNFDDMEDENALRKKKFLNLMCCFVLPKLRKHKKRSGESPNSTAVNSAEDITSAGGISPPNQQLNAGESWHTDDIGIGTGTSNTHSPNEGNIYGIIDNKNKNEKRNNYNNNYDLRNNYNNNYDFDGGFGVQRQTMHGDWHEPAGASQIESDDTEQNSVQRFSNASQKENATKLVQPKSVRTRKSSKPRTKRAISPRKSVNEHHYSISPSSTKGGHLFFSVLIKMPVFMNSEEAQDNFMYTFKLPPPNEISAEEVNRQQLKVEPRPMPKAKTTNRNNLGKVMSAATTRTTSNSSTYRNIGLDTKLDNSYEEQFQKTVEMPIKQKGKNSHSKNVKVNLQNAPFDPTDAEKADNNQQNSDYEFSKDEMEMAIKKSTNVNWQSTETQKPIQIEGGKKEKVPEEVVGKGKEIVEEVKKEGKTKKPKLTKVGETSNARKESPKDSKESLKPAKESPKDSKESLKPAKESPKSQKKMGKIRGQKHSDGERKKSGQKPPDSAAEGTATDSFPPNNSFDYSNKNLQNLNSTPEKTINIDGAESPKMDIRKRGKSVLKSQNVFQKSLDSDGNSSTNSVPQKDSPDHWTEQSSNSKGSNQILESEQEVQNPYDAYDLNNDQSYEETDLSVASSEFIEKDKESLQQIWDRVKPDRITNLANTMGNSRVNGNLCQDSGKLPESTFPASEKLSEIKKKRNKTPGIIVAEHAEVVGRDGVDVQQQKLDNKFDPKEGQTIENAVQNEEELSERENDQNILKKVDGIRSHEQSSSSTSPNVAHGMAQIDHPISIEPIGTEDDYIVNEADLKLLEENLKALHLSREELLEILMHSKKEQKKKLDLNLTEAELPYLKQYLEVGHFGDLKPPKEETKIVGIAVILREWLDDKTDAFEGLTAEEIEKIKEILQKIYPNEGIESVSLYDDFEESDEKPLIRKRKGNNEKIAERLKLMNSDFEQKHSHFSIAEQNQADEEATNSELDDLCRNKFQANRCENLYKMVEDDLEAIRSDAESRAHLGTELQKLCQKQQKNNENCQFGGTEDLDEFLQNLSADDLDWLRTELEMGERGKASDSKNMGTYNIEQEKNKKLFKKSTKSMAFDSDSDIGIKTDSELLKKKQRQSRTAHRLKPSRLGTKNIKDALLEGENDEMQNAKEKNANLKLEAKPNKTIHNEVMDKLHQPHEQNLPATYKKTEDGQKVASYLEWKKLTERSEEKRQGKNDGLDGPISDAEWEETNHPNDAITAEIQNNATTIEQQQQQRPGGFLNRQINRLSSALTGIMMTAEAEQEPEQQSYFEHLVDFLLDYDNSFPYHGLEECDDENNAQ